MLHPRAHHKLAARLRLHLKPYSCGTGLLPAKLRKRWVCFEVKQTGRLSLNHKEVASDSGGQLSVAGDGGTCLPA